MGYKSLLILDSRSQSLPFHPTPALSSICHKPLGKCYRTSTNTGQSRSSPVPGMLNFSSLSLPLHSHSFCSALAPFSALSASHMPPFSAPTGGRQNPSSVSSAIFGGSSLSHGPHKGIGSDEVKAVGAQFPEFISYPDTFDLGEDTSTSKLPNSESRRVMSEASVIRSHTCNLDSDGTPMITPTPRLTSIHRSAYITPADFDEFQRKRLGKRKRTHSSGT